MLELLEQANRALDEAKREHERYLKEKDIVALRNASKKGWMATFLAADYLLTFMGYKKPESGEERRRGLRKLEKEKEEVKEQNLRDRFGSRAYHLHALGFYEGNLEIDELAEELEKVREYIEIVKKLTR